MSTYTALVSRDGRFWHIDAAEAEARSHAATELRAAATELKNAGLSVRELGAVLGISYQRASQLTSGAGLSAKRRRAS